VRLKQNEQMKKKKEEEAKNERLTTKQNKTVHLKSKGTFLFFENPSLFSL
jgi:hypothetical protein